MLRSFLGGATAAEQDDRSTSDSSSLGLGDRDGDVAAVGAEPLCLEGFLYVRKHYWRSYGWRRRFVVLSMQGDGGGSLTVYKLGPNDSAAFTSTATTALRKVYSKPARMAKSLQRRLSVMGNFSEASGSEFLDSEHGRQMDVEFGFNVPWMAKDIINDSSTFMVEVVTDDELADENDHEADDYDDESDVSSLSAHGTAYEAGHIEQYTLDSHAERSMVSVPGTLSGEHGPRKVYFRCQKGKGSNEKALWLRAFDRLNRLSTEKFHSSFIGSLTHKLTYYQKSRNRIRSKSNALFARHVRQLELNDDDDVSQTADSLLAKNLVSRQPRTEDVHFVHHDVERMVHGPRPESSKNKEYRVQPRYAYPHRWMTRQELMEEMTLTSETFHDLRVPGCKQKEIGSLRVEVLQCFGLPKLDRTADTDGIVYLVCGSYAFATDVILNNANPMWPRKAKRACEFPLFHAFARLYVGVFDDDASRTKDEFAGRVVLDLARLRPYSIYDVTLPLRLSAHVYSRRRRGAVRLRFSIRWHTERDALASYIPSKVRIPLPQNSKPKTDVTVLCSDRKAFRNIAITVHGAHLPGKFTFHQMRAAIREINFTRKYIFTLIRHWIRETRHWHHPTFSAFVFLAWMHCLYINTFALVPAYLVSYFALILTRNYVKYGIDGPINKGFIPPSWEELFMALIKGGDSDYHAIEPLELGIQANSLDQFRALEELDGDEATNTLPAQTLPIDYKAKTHIPRGKFLFRLLGLLSNADDAFVSADDCHLEFPFADGDIKHYPKFTVKEALVGRNGEDREERSEESNGEKGTLGERRVVTNGKGEIRLIPRLPKRLEMEIPDIMRKDSSGMNDRDEEENKFKPRRAMLASGKHVISSVSKPTKRTVKDMTKTAKTATEAATNIALTATGAGFTMAKVAAKSSLQAASSVAKTAGEFGEMTGLNHVVTPVTSTIQTGYQGVANTLIMPVSRSGQKFLRNSLQWEQGDDSLRDFQARIAMEVAAAAKARSSCHSDGDDDGSEFFSDNPSQSHLTRKLSSSSTSSRLAESEAIFSAVKPADETQISEVMPVEKVIGGSGVDDMDIGVKWPEQNIDVEGPSTGRKVTDDLQEIKDRVHDLTWHRFDDKIYVIKNREALYFGQAKKPEKRRTTRSIDKDLEKLMKVGQYSHNNPFVSRMGQYVEPIIGSANSFLCLFRAMFNVMTWRDPLLTFWISFLSWALAIILFVFPWRIFLFGLGIHLVGPHLWLLRVLREKGYLPPLRRKKRIPAQDDFETGIPSHQPLFTCKDRESGESMGKPVKVDPREVHRVVVPYSPLIYNRFYDWPPEPQYAQVRRDPVYESSERRVPVPTGRKPRNPWRPRTASADYRSRHRTSSWDGALLPALPESPVDSSSFDGAMKQDMDARPDGLRRRR